jgi:serine/threonine protein kinase
VDVAVKFIIRKKVPVHGWVQDSKLGRLPTEIWLLSRIQHPNIADFLEYFEDDVYYYLVRSMIRITFGVAQLLWKGSRASWFSLGLKTRTRGGWPLYVEELQHAWPL